MKIMSRLSLMGAVVLAACHGGAAPEAHNVEIAVAGDALVEGSNLVVSATQRGTTNVVQASAAMSGQGASLFMALSPGVWDFQGTLTPPGAASPSHTGSTAGVRVGANRIVAVNLVLTRVLSGSGVTVSVTVDDRAVGMPSGVTGVLVDPSTSVYGGETVTVSVLNTDPTLRFGWQSDGPLLVSQAGGPTTTFVAPTAHGSYPLTLLVFTPDDAPPATMTVPFQVVAGGVESVGQIGDLGGFLPTTDLAWDGNEFLASWGAFSESTAQAIGTFLARVSPQGVKLAPEALISKDGGETSLFFTGVEVGLAWDGSAGATFEELTPTGTPLFGSDRFQGVAPKLGFDGQTFGQLVVNHLQAPGIQILFNGFNLVAAPANIAFARPLALIWNGAEYGAFWLVLNNDSSLTVWFARLDSGGNKLAPEVVVASPGNFGSLPAAVTWSGFDYVLAFSAANAAATRVDIYAQRIAPSGALEGAPQPVTTAATLSAEPSIACAGNDCAVVWDDARDGRSEIYLARFRPSGHRRPDIRVTSGPGDSGAPRLVAAGDGYGIIFASGGIETPTFDPQVGFAVVSGAQ